MRKETRDCVQKVYVSFFFMKCIEVSISSRVNTNYGTS